MKKVKQYILQLPEYLLVGSVLIYWIFSGPIINPIALAALLVLVLQIIYKNRIVGLLIPSLLVSITFYFLLALLSEFHEFPTFTVEARNLLIGGLSFVFVGFLTSAIMFYKYAAAIDYSTNKNPVSE
jgi:hypothetical protein